MNDKRKNRVYVPTYKPEVTGKTREVTIFSDLVVVTAEGMPHERVIRLARRCANALALAIEEEKNDNREPDPVEFGSPDPEFNDEPEEGGQDDGEL